MTAPTTFSTWEETDMSVFALKGDPIGRVGRWTFWEHPTEGDEYPLLAVSLDFIGDNGPVIFNTHAYDMPIF